MNRKRVNIAILASGGGSNAQCILERFQDHPAIRVELIISNKENAFVLERANRFGVKTFIHSKEDVQDGKLLAMLKNHAIDFIVLAGYLQKVGEDLIRSYPNSIVNIHPALLPKFGGKGMYGMHVHHAVKAAHEVVSGPTIHYVNEHYDEGAIIEQHLCEIDEKDSAEDIQKKVLALEHKYFAVCVEKLIKERYDI